MTNNLTLNLGDFESMAFTADVDGLELSPDGTRLVYTVGRTHRPGDYRTSSLWYSPDVTKADSAKQLTCGVYNDGSPAWHPDARENTLYFLSDRHRKGGPRQIYTYALGCPGEPHLLSDKFSSKKRATTNSRISPDGLYIAFSSSDEPSREHEMNLAEKDDANVWGENLANARLRLYTISTGDIRTLVYVNKHVTSYTWSADSKSLLYILCDGPDAEFRSGQHTACVVSIKPSLPHSPTRHLIDFQHAPASDVVWPSRSYLDIFYLYTYIPQNNNDALAVYRHSLDMDRTVVSENKRFYLGEFAVGAATGMDTRVDVLDRDGKIYTLYETSKRKAIGSFDIKKVDNGYVMACIRSSGPNKEAPNVWVGKSSGIQSLALTTKLSPSHFPWIASSSLGDVEIFEWKGKDDVCLNGMAWFPKGVDSANLEKPLPTILHIHGGPYLCPRDTKLISISHILAAHPTEKGFLVLSPNYRGNLGRGYNFVQTALPATGWPDVESMVDEAVKRGLADKDKLAIGGWSFDGYLAAWGVNQTKNKFRCGIMGAGLSDWGSRGTNSDLPDAGDEIGGTAPWMNTAINETGDPIRHVKDIETAMLVVHGECDDRVPVAQGIGLHRGLRRMSKYPDRHSLVIYPREGHLSEEQKHVEDLLRRVIGHFQAWLK